MTPRYDVAVVGGGPVGLAAAAAAARKGLSVVLLEREALPHDKACGEGVMPAGLAVLERLGARARIPADQASPFRGIRYVQEDGTSVEGQLPGTGGLGIRRTALSAALLDTARAAGVDVRDHTGLRSQVTTTEAVTLETDGEQLSARILVAADGLHSPLRHAAGLDVPARRRRRFGLRQHFLRPPWTDRVEVHLSERAEAYVTPCGPSRVGIAFLWSDRTLEAQPTIARFLELFPRLAARVAEAPADSVARGAGPFQQRARAWVADRFVLLGDAAGYVDAITGEGLSLGFVCAEALAENLPGILVQEGRASAFRPYLRRAERAFRSYAWTAGAVLALARRPRLRRAVLHRLAARPPVFEWLLANAVS
jgi:2-polyprenyl-6-methoxyphenol hydroxylase-like FAD-dependent oxidoreductase